MNLQYYQLLPESIYINLYYIFQDNKKMINN